MVLLVHFNPFVTLSLPAPYTHQILETHCDMRLSKNRKNYYKWAS